VLQFVTASAEKRAKLDEIDLHFHDLRHEAGSRKLEAGWPLHAVSAFLGHASVTTTARYLNVKDDYLQELIERNPLRSCDEAARRWNPLQSRCKGRRV
jgi:integrase